MEAKPKRNFLKRYANSLKRSIDQLKLIETSITSKFSSKPAGYQYKHFQLKRKISKSKLVPFRLSTNHFYTTSPASPSSQGQKESVFKDLKIVSRKKEKITKERKLSKLSKRNFSVNGEASIYVNFIKEQEIRPKSVSPVGNSFQNNGRNMKKKKSIKIQLVLPETELT